MNRSRTSRLLIVTAFACAAVVAYAWHLSNASEKSQTTDTAVETVALAAPVDFSNDVRPILASNCLPCHGFDPSTREADLRLDIFKGATAIPEHGGLPAITPGDPTQSELMHRITSDNVHDRMPAEAEPLTREQIETLKAWIENGAAYERHWSLEAIVDFEPPNVDDPIWSLAPVDRFVRARQQRADLPAPVEADRRTLIRRLSFDLTGLPPSPVEIADFENDERQDAYERVVDRLLASEHFGERWARHWLDLMRYAETYAHEFDYPIRHAWRYRDYVIRALNSDVPYEAFVTEHLAGDLLTTPRIHPTEAFNESIIGTGFWWLSQGTHAPVDVRLDEAERIDNQIDVMTKAFLATTVSCARCHDHKFDPIYTSEYYGFAGYLQSSRRQEAYLDPGKQIQATVDAIRAMQTQAESTQENFSANAPGAGEIRELLLASALALYGNAESDSSSDSPHDIDDEELAAWTVALTENVSEHADDPLRMWLELAEASKGDPAAAVMVDSPETDSTREPLFEITSQQSLDGWFRSGWAFHDTPNVAGSTYLRAGRSHIAEHTALDSGILGQPVVGTLRSPTFEITGPRLGSLVRGKGEVRVIIDGFTMDEYNALLFEGMKVSVDSDHWHWRTHNVSRYIGHRAHYEIIDDQRDGAIQFGGLHWLAPSHPTTTTTFDFSDAHTFEARTTAIARAAARALTGDSDGGPAARVANWLIEHNLISTIDVQDAVASLADTIPDAMRVTASQDGTSEDEYVFIRGSHKTLGDIAPRGFLSALVQDPLTPIETGSGRLRLAAKMFDPSNPMPARVMTNRVWRHLLGQGLVRTPDDFGLLGQEPTHPELLDWLASRFSGEMQWSIKALVREIVLSRTYRSASGALGEQAQLVDPTNRLLSVRDPKRLDGESVRDAILAVSGRLDPSLYGPSVPVHLTDFMTGRGRPGQSGPVDGNGRRSIYLEVRRNFLTPMLQAFDSPTPHSTIGKRNESNVPAQSLILLNDPFVAQQARVLAEQVTTEFDSHDERLSNLYRRTLGRVPSIAESHAAATFLLDQTMLHKAATDAESDAPLDTTPAQIELLAWTDFCHVIFNLKEFRYIE